MNKIVVKSFTNIEDRTSYTYFFNTDVEIEYCNVRIDGWNFLDQPVNNKERTCDNIQKSANGRRDVYTISCLLDYHCFKGHYIIIIIIIIIYLSK